MYHNVPKKILTLISSYLSLFESPPSCLSLFNFDVRLGTSLIASLPGIKRPMIVSGFGPMELEKCLAMPTSRNLERHNSRTLLDFLLLKLRTALDQELLTNKQFQFSTRYGFFLILYPKKYFVSSTNSGLFLFCSMCCNCLTIRERHQRLLRYSLPIGIRC